jgi:diaminopimelate decarboxylase
MRRVDTAVANADIYPDTARTGADGHLTVGGCDLVTLAQTYGTPLYVYDEASIRTRARSFRDALATAYPGRATVCYGAKAYCAPWLLRLVAEEGLGLDVVSGGELQAALATGFPTDRVYLHGNNKSAEELALALDSHIARVVVDNLEEVELLARLARVRGVRQGVLLRVGPGVAARTHAHLQTGAAETKFGLDIASGAAAQGVREMLARPELELRGLHMHIGSQIADTEAYREGIDRILRFAAEMRAAGLALRELSPGGGFAVRYVPDDPPADAPRMAAEVARLVTTAATACGFAAALPDLTIEPGRALVATAGVALYRVGSVKRAGARTYAAIDGGMADNIRPTAYGARYTAVLAARAADAAETTVTVAGRYCESGDILIREVRLPLPRAGDLLAVPASGAYHLSMASNYNLVPRPAVVVVADGRPRLVRRRETYDDLLALEQDGR